MPVVTRKRTSEFGIVPNEAAEDIALSFEARGLLVYLLVKPNDWKVNFADIQRAGNIGRDKSYKLINELREAGYVDRSIERGKDGKIKEVTYIVYDCALPSKLPLPEKTEEADPLPEIQDMADPLPEFPDPVLPDPENTDRITNKQKTQKTHSPLPPREEFEKLWAGLKRKWPKKQLPDKLDAAKAAFERLDAVERRHAHDFCEAHISFKFWVNEPAHMFKYFSEKGWEHLRNDPPLQANDGFLIKPYRPEWQPWLEHIKATRGEAEMKQVQRRGQLIAARRWPEPTEESQLELAVSNG